MSASPLPLTALGSDMRHLRPLTGPEILDRAWALFADRWRVLVPCVLIVSAATLAQAWFVAGKSPLGEGAKTGILLVLFAFAELAAAIALSTCFQGWLYPRRMLDMEPLARASFNRLLPFVVTRLVFYFVAMMFLLSIPVWLLTQGAKSYSPVLCAVLAAGSIMAGLALLLHWALASMVVLVERKGLFTGLNRSMELMRTGAANALGVPPPVLRLLLGLLPALLVVATGYLIADGWFAQRTGTSLRATILADGFTPSAQFAFYAAQAGVLLFLFPVMWPLMAVLYTDCRMRREGLDFQMRLLENGGWDGSPLDPESIAGA